jgi:transposase
MIGLFGSCKARPNISEELAGQIEFVCSDMWQPYLTVIRERCGQAIHILDRFHIVAKMNTALDQVRAGEARTLARDGYEPVLKKTRSCVLKRKTNLTRQQRFRLRDLLRYNLQTVRAYLLKEDFQQLWEYESPSWAAKFLDEWCSQVMRSRIEPMRMVEEGEVVIRRIRMLAPSARIGSASSRPVLQQELGPVINWPVSVGVRHRR